MNSVELGNTREIWLKFRIAVSILFILIFIIFFSWRTICHSSFNRLPGSTARHLRAIKISQEFKTLHPYRFILSLFCPSIDLIFITHLISRTLTPVLQTMARKSPLKLHNRSAMLNRKTFRDITVLIHDAKLSRRTIPDGNGRRHLWKEEECSSYPVFFSFFSNKTCPTVTIHSILTRYTSYFCLPLQFYVYELVGWFKQWLCSKSVPRGWKFCLR